MTVEQAVRTHLASDAGVAAIAGARVYQLKLPQTPTLPAVRVQLIDEPLGYQLRGRDGATRARVQTDAYASESTGADPYASVTDLAAAVDEALSGQTFEVSGLRVTGAMRASRRVGYEAPELRLLRCSQDYTVWTKQL